MRAKKEAKKNCILLSQLILSCVLFVKPALAKSLNPHWKPQSRLKKISKTRKESPASFSGDGWSPEITKAINKLIADKGNASPHYNPRKPPIATIPWEGVVTDGDADELVFWRLIRRADFKFSNPFWNIVPIAYGRQKLRAAYEQFSPLPKTIWNTQPTYHQYLKYFVKSYQDQCLETGIKSCRIYLSRLWFGFTPQEAASYVQITLNQEKFQALKKEIIAEPPEDRAPVYIRRGIRIRPQALGLIQSLNNAGFDIWIISADAEPTLKAALSWAGISYAHPAGIKMKLDKKGIFNGKISQPLPFWGGETATVIFHTGRTPALSVGFWPQDQAILSYGNGLKILISGKDKTLVKTARKKGWLIQPAFQ
jgi:hypothetical protein